MDRTEKNAAAAARRNKFHHKKTSRKEQPEKTTKKKSTIEDALPSNWSKYEISEQSDEETNQGANFKTLLDEPLSEGSHFKFKDEQNWSNQIEMQSQFSKYFTLDLKLLSEGVGCVPFSKRHDFDVSIFLYGKTNKFNINIKYF